MSPITSILKIALAQNRKCVTLTVLPVWASFINLFGGQKDVVTAVATSDVATAAITATSATRMLHIWCLQAFVTCSVGVQMVGYVMMSQAIFSASSSFLSDKLLKYFGRTVVIFSGNLPRGSIVAMTII